MPTTLDTRRVRPPRHRLAGGPPPGNAATPRHADPALRTCVVCGAAMRQRLRPWAWHCRQCGYWAADLGASGPRINPQTSVIQCKREDAFYRLRMAGHRRCLEILKRFGPLQSLRLLDVGCAHGWFLTASQAEDMAALGLEPEESVAEAALAAGRPVRMGFFPDAIRLDEQFDVISFNDVFEHLHDLRRVLEHCHGILRRGGKLVLSVPNSRGFFYRLGCSLARIGCRGALERLWQVGYTTPHLSYFHAQNLQRLMAAAGFTLLYSGSLPSYCRQGLWSRVHLDRPKPSLLSIAAFGLLWLLQPVLCRWLPSDHLLQVYQKADAGDAG